MSRWIRQNISVVRKQEGKSKGRKIIPCFALPRLQFRKKFSVKGCSSHNQNLQTLRSGMLSYECLGQKPSSLRKNDVEERKYKLEVQTHTKNLATIERMMEKIQEMEKANQRTPEPKGTGKQLQKDTEKSNEPTRRKSARLACKRKLSMTRTAPNSPETAGPRLSNPTTLFDEEDVDSFSPPPSPPASHSPPHKKWMGETSLDNPKQDATGGTPSADVPEKSGADVPQKAGAGGFTIAEITPSKPKAVTTQEPWILPFLPEASRVLSYPDDGLPADRPLPLLLPYTEEERVSGFSLPAGQDIFEGLEVDPEFALITPENVFLSEAVSDDNTFGGSVNESITSAALKFLEKWSPRQNSGFFR
eukprot:g43093.t1